MTAGPGSPTPVHELETRIKFLEELNRATFEAIDLLVSFGEFQGHIKPDQEHETILDLSRQYLNRLMPFRTLAFLTVNEADFDFALTSCVPEADRGLIEKEVDLQIEQGTFAWALYQNRAVMVSSEDMGQTLVFHPLATRSRILGFFVGILSDGQSTVTSIWASLLTIILFNTATALENSSMNQELERKIAERTKQLKATQVQLFQTSKLATMGEMAAGLAHELNQPLAGMSLTCKHLLKLTERGRLTEEVIRTGLQDVEGSVKRMSGIIRHIRTFARQDTLEFIEVDIGSTLDYALNLLKGQIEQHEIEVVKEVSQTLPKVQGEPYQLEQVWINIISNARDALDEAGKRPGDGPEPYQKRLAISVSLEQVGGRESVIISFKDNGIGMTSVQKEKMFEPFYTTKEVDKGTGLGMSISFGIIENHGGRIELESELGEGTLVKVILPAENQP